LIIPEPGPTSKLPSLLSKKIKPVKTPGGRYRIPEEQLTLPTKEQSND